MFSAPLQLISHDTNIYSDYATDRLSDRMIRNIFHRCGRSSLSRPPLGRRFLVWRYISSFFSLLFLAWRIFSVQEFICNYIHLSFIDNYCTLKKSHFKGSCVCKRPSRRALKLPGQRQLADVGEREDQTGRPVQSPAAEKDHRQPPGDHRDHRDHRNYHDHLHESLNIESFETTAINLVTTGTIKTIEIIKTIKTIRIIETNKTIEIIETIEIIFVRLIFMMIRSAP